MRRFFICLALIGGCVTSQEEVLTKASGSWAACSLEASELGFYGREIILQKNGVLRYGAGYYKDGECQIKGPYFVQTDYEYSLGATGEDGLTTLRIKTPTGKIDIFMKEAEGYLYLPQNLADGNPSQQSIDMNSPFSPREDPELAH